MILKRINFFKKEFQLLLKKEILHMNNLSRFLDLREELNDLVDRELIGMKIHKSWKGINSPKKHTFLFPLSLAYTLKTLRLNTATAYQKKYLKNAIKELLKDYLRWIEKAEKTLLEKNLKKGREVSDLSLAKHLLGLGNQIIIRRATGSVISLILSSYLLKLYKKERLKLPKDDDIKPLYENLRKKTKNTKLKIFLNKNYSYFNLAGKTRIRSVHIKEKAPKKGEIETVIDLTTRLMEKFKV